MEPKTTLEKLQILLPHWIEHNQNHAAEFQKWAAAARADGATSLAAILDQAAANMLATDTLLKQASAEAGTPVVAHHHHHEHPHGHSHGTHHHDSTAPHSH